MGLWLLWGGESWVREGEGLSAVLLIPDPTFSQNQQPGLDSEAFGRGGHLLRHEILQPTGWTGARWVVRVGGKGHHNSHWEQLCSYSDSVCKPG